MVCLKEDAQLRLQNLIWQYKTNREEILRRLISVTNTNINGILLILYPMGAHPSLEMRELPLGKPQKICSITQTAAGFEKLTVGRDYPTHRWNLIFRIILM
jgi:UDP-glucose 4-epimerase